MVEGGGLLRPLAFTLRVVAAQRSPPLRGSVEPPPVLILPKFHGGLL